MSGTGSTLGGIGQGRVRQDDTGGVRVVRSRALIITIVPDASDALFQRGNDEVHFEQVEMLQHCAAADVAKLQACLQDLQCDRVEVVQNVSSQALLQAGGILSSLRTKKMGGAGGFAPAGGAEGRGAGASGGDKGQETGEGVFVFILALGRRNDKGMLSVRTADGAWVTMTQVAEKLFADTDASLCTLVASTFSLDGGRNGGAAGGEGGGGSAAAACKATAA